MTAHILRNQGVGAIPAWTGGVGCLIAGQ